MGELITSNTDRAENNGEINEPEDEKLLPTMKKELSKKELKQEEKEKLREIEESLELTKDIQCGLGCMRGSFLQKFANQEAFVIVYGLLGAIIAAGASYSSGTLSTIEKRFRIPSQNIGVILIGNDITSLLFGIVITYYAGRRHKPRWMAIGMLFLISCSLMFILPQLIYGAGTEALSLTEEYESLHLDTMNNSIILEDDSAMCSRNSGKCIREGSLAPQAIFFGAQLLWGIGGPLYGNLGLAYMDDNIKRSKTPILISFSYFIRMLGPVGGYALASFSLKHYIAPTMTPIITTSDPRWIGAWWLGWILIAILEILLTLAIALFPKELPNFTIRKILAEQAPDSIKKEDDANTSWKDMGITFKRLLKNKVLMCNTTASCFYVLGYYPYWTFMPKYIEIQYRVSASFAALVTGVVGLVFTAMGILLAGGVISRFKPRARPLAAFNIFAGVVTMLGIWSYVYLGCPEGDEFNLKISKANQEEMSSCNENCNCEFARYAPVCSMDGTQTTFITPCHAGCHSEEIINGTRIFQNCSCIASTASFHSHYKQFGEDGFFGGSAKMGGCPIDCMNPFYIFLAVVCLMKFVGAAAKTSNVLISVRCVEEKDKAVSMSFGMTALALFGFIPAPIIFGWLMDQTCVLWGKTCSGTGNCWVYDGAKLRLLLNYSAFCVLALSNIFDVAVWYYVKDIQIFDEKIGQERKDTENSKPEENINLSTNTSAHVNV